MVFERFRQRLRWSGTAGTPPSGNGASSFHLAWMVDPPAAGRAWVAVDAVLEVLVAPSVPALSFWALQASFQDRGRAAGAGHLGLQWHSGHPGSTAVNWGGYGPGGGELDGSTSSLPSAMGNVNTRDYRWGAGVGYRLRISHVGVAPGGLHVWRGEVTDLARGETTVVRDLFAEGSALTDAIVWSEVFARCDDPSAARAVERPDPRGRPGPAYGCVPGAGELPEPDRGRVRHHRLGGRRRRGPAGDGDHPSHAAGRCPRPPTGQLTRATPAYGSARTGGAGRERADQRVRS